MALQVAQSFRQQCCKFLTQLLPQECSRYVLAASGQLLADATTLSPMNDTEMIIDQIPGTQPFQEHAISALQLL